MHNICQKTVVSNHEAGILMLSAQLWAKLVRWQQQPKAVKWGDAGWPSMLSASTTRIRIHRKIIHYLQVATGCICRCAHAALVCGRCCMTYVDADSGRKCGTNEHLIPGNSLLLSFTSSDLSVWLSFQVNEGSGVPSLCMTMCVCVCVCVCVFTGPLSF